MKNVLIIILNLYRDENFVLLHIGYSKNIYMDFI